MIAICTYIMLMASKRYELSDSMKTLLLSFIGMALGAKFFGFLTGIYRDIGLGKPAGGLHPPVSLDLQNRLFSFRLLLWEDPFGAPGRPLHAAYRRSD